MDCGGCRKVQDIDLRKIDRHPAAAVTRLTLSLRCKRCNGHGPMPVAIGLTKLRAEPTRKAGDVAHAGQLEALALEWADMAGAIERAAAAELAARTAAKKADEAAAIRLAVDIAVPDGASILLS